MNFFRSSSPSPAPATPSRAAVNPPIPQRAPSWEQTSSSRSSHSSGSGGYKESGMEEKACGGIGSSATSLKVNVYLAVDAKDWKNNLLWVLQNVPRDKQIVLLHVHCPAKHVPMMGASFPIDQLNEHEVAAFRQIEKQKMDKNLLKYQTICARVKLQAQKLVIDMDDIAEGILKLITEHKITELFIGAAADKNFSKKMNKPTSKIALRVQQEAAATCKIWFLCKGNLICTREAISGGHTAPIARQVSPLSASTQAEASTAPVSVGKRQIPLANLLASSKADSGSDSSRTPSFDSRDDKTTAPDSRSGSFDLRSNLGVMPAVDTKGSHERSEDAVGNPSSRSDHRHSSPQHYMKDDSASSDTYNDIRTRANEAQKDKMVNTYANETIKTSNGVESARDSESQLMHEQKVQLELQLNKANSIIKDLQEKLAEAHSMLLSLEREQDDLRQERDNAVLEAQQLRHKVSELEYLCHSKGNFTEFSYDELKEATNNFNDSMKIGEGGYGSVYRGVLRHTTVAIKLLNPQGMQGKSEFHKEMDVLSKVRHPNLVTLIGSCPEAWALVYEFLPNGSLEDRLTCKDNSLPLSWQTRTRIAAEICSALVFLHTHKPLSVVHGDLKPANILLDANLVSRVGDFGICRLLESNASTILFRCTHPMGTFVYMDPEFLASGELRPSSDVYAFGIILLRLLTGRSAMGIINLVHDALEEDRLQDIVDASAGHWPSENAKKFADIGLRCCETSRKNRPNLAEEVCQALEAMSLEDPNSKP